MASATSDPFRKVPLCRARRRLPSKSTSAKPISTRPRDKIRRNGCKNIRAAAAILARINRGTERAQIVAQLLRRAANRKPSPSHRRSPRSAIAFAPGANCCLVVVLREIRRHDPRIGLFLRGGHEQKALPSMMRERSASRSLTLMHFLLHTRHGFSAFLARALLPPAGSDPGTRLVG